jgi:ribosomal protein S12 methylthiotransferase accessory factor
VVEAFGDRAANRKRLAFGSHRVAPLDDTIERVLSRSEVIGLTRLADVTDLDVLRIPNYAAICPAVNYPFYDGFISVFGGKGVTKSHAKASALMEAAERYSCIMERRFTVLGTYRELSRRYNIAHPNLFVYPGTEVEGDDDELEWVHARSLLHDDLVLVPARQVFAPYAPLHLPAPDGSRRSFSSTNGLASGNTIEEATLHALLEAVERDAEALSTCGGSNVTLDLDSVAEPAAAELVRQFQSHGLQLQVRCISQDIGIPVFLAICVDHDLRLPQYVNGGKGAHLDPVVALTRALTEASQSRVTGIAGVREDMSAKRARLGGADFGDLYQRHRDSYENTPDVRTFASFASTATESVVDDLDIVLRELRAAGTPDVFLVDLTRPELDIPVARVLVPLLEFDIEGNWFGPRALRVLREQPS